MIVGHNILGFDYRVLNTVISIENEILSKTIDTLLILKSINPAGFKGLSLNMLGIRNLNYGKLKTEKSIPKLWREGKEKDVIRYNEEDCNLTFRLWLFLVENSRITSKYYEQELPIELNKKSKRVLRGEAQFYENKNFGFITSMELYDFYNYETDYIICYCNDCNSTTLYENRIVRGFAEFEIIRCQSCNSKLIETRTDGNYRSINIWYGNIKKSNDYDQQINLAKKNHIVNSRDDWDQSRSAAYLLEVGELNTDEICDICSRKLEGIISAPNPLFDNSLICYDCYSAERWRIFDSQ